MVQVGSYLTSFPHVELNTVANKTDAVAISADRSEYALVQIHILLAALQIGRLAANALIKTDRFSFLEEQNSVPAARHLPGLRIYDRCGRIIFPC